MALNYSIHEAKARFFEVIRHVREGKSVTITHRGKPVAEVRSVRHGQSSTLEKRLRNLESRGVLARPALPKRMFQPVQHRPVALARFLAERGE